MENDVKLRSKINSTLNQVSGLEFDDLTTIVKTWITSHIENLTKQGIKLGK